MLGEFVFFACERKGPHLLRPSAVMHNNGQMSDGTAEVYIPTSSPIKHVPLVEREDELELLHKLKKTLWQQFSGRLLSVPRGVLCLLNISHIGFCVSEITLLTVTLWRHQLPDDQFNWKDCKQGSQSRKKQGLIMQVDCLFRTHATSLYKFKYSSVAQ